MEILYYRIKEGSDLVRILYIAHHGEKLVLLSAYDKPNRYEKGKKRKVDKKIESGDTNLGFDLLNRIAVCLKLPLQVGRVSFANPATFAGGLIGIKKHGVPA